MSVACNLVPDEMVELVRRATAVPSESSSSSSSSSATALALQTQLFPLFQSMVAEVNPVPVKVGMELLGLCPANLRLPLLRATPAVEGMVRDALSGLGKL